MTELIADRGWPTVSLLPAHPPELSPDEWVWVWAHVRRNLANLANLDLVALDRLEALVRTRLGRLQHQSGTFDFLAGTGLTLDEPTSP